MMFFQSVNTVMGNINTFNLINRNQQLIAFSIEKKYPKCSSSQHLIVTAY